jgi:5-carboxymethyl-2-hydroxymuconate isomerase
MRAVYGYTIANDITARDLQESEPQWLRGKGMDTFCPLGPTLVTKRDIPDPHALTLTTTVNGETMQNGSTGDMIHRVDALVSYISQWITLDAGDVILTGTPAGVGKGMKPPRYLKNGDVVSVSIDGIGTLTNPCQTIP